MEMKWRLSLTKHSEHIEYSCTLQKWYNNYELVDSILILFFGNKADLIFKKKSFKIRIYFEK